MHGVIFNRLRQYAEEKVGPSAWRDILHAAGLGDKIHLAIESYPDTELVVIVQTASKLTNIPVPDLLFDFGRALVPTYLQMYGHLVQPSWRTLDVIEHTEETIHKVVRIRNPGAAPPILHAKRTSPSTLTLEYASHRRLCAVARGIMDGVAAHFSEKIAVDERTCMLRGDGKCTMHVSRS